MTDRYPKALGHTDTNGVFHHGTPQNRAELMQEETAAKARAAWQYENRQRMKAQLEQAKRSQSKAQDYEP